VSSKPYKSPEDNERLSENLRVKILGIVLQAVFLIQQNYLKNLETSQLVI
jgi:hypothetical protein